MKYSCKKMKECDNMDEKKSKELDSLILANVSGGVLDEKKLKKIQNMLSDLPLEKLQDLDSKIGDKYWKARHDINISDKARDDIIDLYHLVSNEILKRRS